jgi:Zn-dependent oligopeptidase
MTKFDFDLHLKNIKEPADFWKRIFKKYSKMEVYKESLMPAGFGHIVGGYDAGYYSYLWALVYADDIFSIFEKEGVYNKKIGGKYLREILEVGSSRDEEESVRKFLGRKSNNKAFLKKIF